MRAALAAAALAALAAGPARADDPAPIPVTIKDHRFLPAEVHVPAGKPAVLEIRNEDATAEEFESRALKVEKVVAGGKSATVHLRPLDKGRYPFFGDYHQRTAQGVVIAD